MPLSISNILSNFLRNCPEPFSAKEVLCMINAIGEDMSLSKLKNMLDSDPRTFKLSKRQYITRTGAFTGKVFCIVPTQKEIEEKVLIPGDRCIPFVDSEQFSFTLSFEYLGNMLKNKTIYMDKFCALDLFSLYGEEYSVQYIAADPSCDNLRIAENDFELPQQVPLTGIDISPLLKDVEFKTGDRLLARVKDWAAGVVEIMPLVSRKENPFSITDVDLERQKWNDLFESALLDSFERMGPCTCMEEQLANVFYENSDKLCVQNCGTVHEFLNSSKKVSVEYFGVESRLWYKGKEIPAVGKWNENLYGCGSEGNFPFFYLPDFLIDCYIKDRLYEKKEELSDLYEKVLKFRDFFSDEEREEIKQIIEEKIMYYKNTYNWFADFPFGAIRHKALELFSRVENFVSDIDDFYGKEFLELPQKELITLSQLFTHIAKILEITVSDMECGEDETYTMQLSLDGMEANFEEIKPMIASAMNKLRKKRFNFI